MKPDKHIEQKLEALAETIGSRNSFVDDVMSKIESSPVQPGKKTETGNIVLRRIKMKSISKFAAAAIIMIGVSAVFLFNFGPGSIALADVYSKVQQVQAFAYKITIKASGNINESMPPGESETNTAVTVSKEYGMKMEQTTHMIEQNKSLHQQIFLISAEKKIVSIDPAMKIYQDIELSEGLFERLKKEYCEPREMIKQMLACDYTDLGRSEIDGITVQGFETTDPAYSAGVFGQRAVTTLWVDVDTWLPVKSKMDIQGNSDTAEASIVIDSFEWNIPARADDFQPVIPDSFTKMGSMMLPEMNENTAIEGLRLFADLTGEYPGKIDLLTLAQKANLFIFRKEQVAQRMQEFRQSGLSVEDVMSNIMQEFYAPIHALGMYHMTLVQDKKDPAYFGNQVTPQDTDAVLMRWKIEGNTYQVIFGDLNTTEMPYEELIQIEPEIKVEQETQAQVIIPDLSKTYSKAQLRQLTYDSMSNVKKMLMACWGYSQKHGGQWPEKLQDLVSDGLDPGMLINPLLPDSDNGYIYLKPPSTRSSQTVVIYEAYHKWDRGINVGFYDGHVEFIRDEADFKNKLSQ